MKEILVLNELNMKKYKWKGNSKIPYPRIH